MPGIIFDEDFEEGYGSSPSWLPMNQVDKPTLNTGHSIENNGYPLALSRVNYNGRNCGQWRLIKTEPLYQADTKPPGTYRTEVTIVKADEDVRVTAESWYRVRVCFPTDGAASDTRKTSIMQWFEDGSDELTLRTQYGRCFLELQNGGDEYRWDIFSTNTTVNNTSVASFAFHPLDEWTQLIFHINHQLDGTGFINVYRDGVLIHEYDGPTIHEKVPKWKIGIYSSYTSSSVPYKILCYDDIRVGDEDSNLAQMMGSENTPPVANAGSDQNIASPESTATLTGDGSTDSDGTITDYEWTQLSGPNTAGITSPSSANTGLTGLIPGTYTFNLQVTDDDGATNSDTVDVVVDPVPVAVAGSDQVITLPTNTATLDGSGSYDENGTITDYAWTKISGPATGSITSPSSAITGLTGLVEGLYVFRLTVTDDDSTTDADDVGVTVNGIPASAPVADAGSNQSVTAPNDSTTLSGSAEGNIAEYLWEQISGPNDATIASPDTAETEVTGLVPGIYVFRLTVTDDDDESDTSEVTITVYAAYVPTSWHQSIINKVNCC